VSLNAAPTDLTGKTCIVTGANGGIGVAVVEHFTALGATVHAGHMGSPSDVARVAMFLASEQSAYMTAQTIGVDGGSVLR